MDRAVISIALVHHPVVNRHGEIIASAVTNLDIHDLARLAKTYDIHSFFVVTPVQEQQDMVRELVAHWREGSGGMLNPDRREAFDLVRVTNDIRSAMDCIAMETGGKLPEVYATTAKPVDGAIEWSRLREEILSGSKGDCLILFGTASGLAETVLQDVRGVLAPISGPGEYNHLSVRCAAAIAIDRLMGV